MKTLNAPAWLTERPIAHRGLHDKEQGVIENTLGAARAAFDGGFAIECDVQMSADEEVFVFHDDTLDRLTNASGRLIEKTAAEIRKAQIRSPRAVPSPPVEEGGDGGSRASLRREPAPNDEGDVSPAGRLRIPTFAEFLALVAGKTPIICELKSRFDDDWRIADRTAALAASYEGPLAFESFDPNLIAYLRLRYPKLGPPGTPCPIGIVAEGSYDDPGWSFLRAEQKREWTDFEHYDRTRPDFLSFNVDHLPHAVPFFVKELLHAPILAWTVCNAAQGEAARKWADQIVFEGAGRP